jgi:hypothetical protein
MTIERLKAITPVMVLNAMHWRNTEHRELFLSGLRHARSIFSSLTRARDSRKSSVQRRHDLPPRCRSV